MVVTLHSYRLSLFQIVFCCSIKFLTFLFLKYSFEVFRQFFKPIIIFNLLLSLFDAVITQAKLVLKFELLFSNLSRQYCCDPNFVATNCVNFESVHFDQYNQLLSTANAKDIYTDYYFYK